VRIFTRRLASTVFLATRELARQPLRALLSVLVAGFVVGLVMTFQGFRVGIYQDLARSLGSALATVRRRNAARRHRSRTGQ